MSKYTFEPTDAERHFVNERWSTINEGTNPGLQLIMEREDARFWRANTKGPGTYVGLKDGRTRLIGPEEFRAASRYAARLVEIWKGFESALIQQAKQKYNTKIKRAEPPPGKYGVAISGCYPRKLPPEWTGEVRRDVRLMCQLRLAESMITCRCDPESVWSGKELHIEPAADKFPLLDGGRPVNEGRAAAELLDEFTV